MGPNTYLDGNLDVYIRWGNICSSSGNGPTMALPQMGSGGTGLGCGLARTTAQILMSFSLTASLVSWAMDVRFNLYMMLYLWESTVLGLI